ncbi:MAG: hypothetical protein CSB13_06590 [Chloroflexi bacterium]|nr:MAG: hypothetical protein CSB13_06590 [Chloroflexota bacterium]
MGRASRQKGQRGERKVRDKFRAIFPDAERELNDFQGNLGTDLRNTGIFRIQVKHYRKHVSPARIYEVKCPDAFVPLLVSWPTNPGTGKPCVAISPANWVRVSVEQDVTLKTVIYRQHCSFSVLGDVNAVEGTIPGVLSAPSADGEEMLMLFYLDDFIGAVDPKKVMV